jgi:Holliday junction resolvase
MVELKIYQKGNMSNRNKEKGKSFERDVCDVLHSVFGLNFQRVPNSGAFIGGKNVVRMDQMSDNQIQLMRGDIIPPKELPNLVIECKARKDFPFHLLFSDVKDVNDWIDQVEIDYNKNMKGIYLVVFKVNNRGSYVIWNNDLFKMTCTDNALGYQYKKVHYVVHRFDSKWIESNKNNITKYSM